MLAAFVSDVRNKLVASASLFKRPEALGLSVSEWRQ